MRDDFAGAWPRDGWLIVAEVGRPHGIRGEVAVRLSGFDAETVVSFTGLSLLRPDGTERKTRVLGVRPKKDGWIARLEGLEDRTDAENWRGSLVIAPRESLPEAGEDEWYVADLVGLSVVTEDGDALGTLEEVLGLPANDVFVVRGPRGEILLPVIDDVVRSVDRDAGTVTVNLLPGLLEEE